MVRRITKKSIQKQKGIEICSFGATIKQTGHFLHYEGLLFVFLFYAYKLTLTEDTKKLDWFLPWSEEIKEEFEIKAD